MNYHARIQIESDVRDCFNKTFHANTVKEVLTFGPNGPVHEFDLYEKNKHVGGVSTSTLRVGKKGHHNTGGKDRAASELLWLSLWSGTESRFHILTCADMANWLFATYHGGGFKHKISIYHYSVKSKAFNSVGQL